MSKETIKKKTKKLDSIEEFIELAKELKELVVSLNQRVSEQESVTDRLKDRLGL